MITQISIYTENKRGTARRIFSLLSKENINVLSLMNGDSGEFGTMRLIVSDSEKAVAQLQDNGYLCRTDNVLGVELEDTPGTLEQLLAKVENMNINISYMYVAFMRTTGKPVIILRCDEMDIVANALQRNGYTIY